MPRMKSRQMPPPTGEGWVYYDPISRWKSPPWQSFDQLAQLLSDYRTAHKDAYARAGLPIDFESCAEAVDQYNANLCARMGWSHLIDPGGPDPNSSAPQRQTGIQKLVAAVGQVNQLVKGYKALKDWKQSEDPPVPAEMSEARAATCVQCPQNQPGNFTDFFTIPLSEAIHKDIEEAQQRGLKTTHDTKLHVCKACLCPLQLKVHTPIQYIAEAMTEEAKAKLREGKNCWILDELIRFSP